MCRLYMCYCLSRLDNSPFPCNLNNLSIAELHSVQIPCHMSGKPKCLSTLCNLVRKLNKLDIYQVNLQQNWSKCSLYMCCYLCRSGNLTFRHNSSNPSIDWLHQEHILGRRSCKLICSNMLCNLARVMNKVRICLLNLQQNLLKNNLYTLNCSYRSGNLTFLQNWSNLNINWLRLEHIPKYMPGKQSQWSM